MLGVAVQVPLNLCDRARPDNRIVLPPSSIIPIGIPIIDTGVNSKIPFS